MSMKCICKTKTCINCPSGTYQDETGSTGPVKTVMQENVRNLVEGKTSENEAWTKCDPRQDFPPNKDLVVQHDPPNAYTTDPLDIDRKKMRNMPVGKVSMSGATECFNMNGLMQNMRVR